MRRCPRSASDCAFDRWRGGRSTIRSNLDGKSLLDLQFSPEDCKRDEKNGLIYLLVEHVSKTNVAFLREIFLIFRILPECDPVSTENRPVSSPISVV